MFHWNYLSSWSEVAEKRENQEKIKKLHRDFISSTKKQCECVKLGSSHQYLKDLHENGIRQLALSNEKLLRLT